MQTLETLILETAVAIQDEQQKSQANLPSVMDYNQLRTRVASSAGEAATHQEIDAAFAILREAGFLQAVEEGGVVTKARVLPSARAEIAANKLGLIEPSGENGKFALTAEGLRTIEAAGQLMQMTGILTPEAAAAIAKAIPSGVSRPAR